MPFDNVRFFDRFFALNIESMHKYTDMHFLPLTFVSIPGRDNRFHIADTFSSLSLRAHTRVQSQQWKPIREICGEPSRGAMMAGCHCDRRAPL